MTFRKTFAFISFLFFAYSLFSQTVTLSGKLIDASSGEGLISATVRVGETGTTTDFDGNYVIELSVGTYSVEATYLGYEPQSQNVFLDSDSVLDFELKESATLLNTATVTGGKFEKPLGEVTVSLEVVKPRLLENTNSTSVDDVLQKIPGVQIIDGQANIRGGSGFSYGAGSRVMLLVDDIPILQADAGTPNWDDIPVENIEQIEVIKGAASSLYGSSALNGVINVRTGYAKSDPETKISTFYTTFNDPAEKDQIWYDSQPYEAGFSTLHKQKFGKFDLVAGTYLFNRESFNKNTYAKYGRGNVNTRYRFTDRLSAGVNVNFNYRDASDFFFWKGLDSLFVNAPSTISEGVKVRYNIDPFLTYFDNSGNTHKIKSRYLNIDNRNNNDQANKSKLWYGEYQFLRKWDNNWVTTAGVVYTGNFVNAELYGDTTFSTRNLATYAQIEKKFFDRLNVSAGFRFENNRLNTPEVVCNVDPFFGQTCDTIPGGVLEESKPVFRIGANYQARKATFIRASYGEGYRFPTIAESFIKTTFGGLPIVPNPGLQSETGWSAEAGVKQGFRAGGFEGFLDLTGFWTEYQDMIEFNSVDIFNFLRGFKSQNVGDTKITGFEASIAGQGNIFGLETNILAGYTYIEPLFKEFDLTEFDPTDNPTEGQRNAFNSSIDENILKYRSRHVAKFDIESGYKNLSVGFAANYNSRVQAVDKTFLLIINGLTQYNEDNPNGNLVLSARASYKFLGEKAKFSIVANNLANKMYSIRPGIMEAPRSITGRLDWKF